jgi:hypothetical protein
VARAPSPRCPRDSPRVRSVNRAFRLTYIAQIKPCHSTAWRARIGT